MTRYDTVVVTGAARGLGRTIAERLAREAATVVLADVADTSETARTVAAQECRPLCVQVDVATERDVCSLAVRLRGDATRVDVLVNNAGISLLRPAEETSVEAWRQVLDVNLTGPFLLCREIGALMLERRSGSIINVASVAGLRGIADRVAYNASKHGLIGLTSTLAAEWGGRGVRVNAVCPGWIKTEMDVEDQASGAYSDSDIENQVPMGRFARSEDVAEVVAFLADSALSGFVNGAAIPVDGGWTADGSWTSLRLRARQR